MEGKEDADIIKSRNWLKRMRRPYVAHLCPVQRGVVVVFLLSASDDVVIGTKLPATLPPILVICFCVVKKQHPCSLLKRNLFVCLFNATSNLIPDHWKRQTIISSLRQRFLRGYRCILAAALLILVWCCRSFPIPLPRPRYVLHMLHVLHVLASARTQIRIYLRNKHKRRVEMKLEWCKQT